MKSISSYILDLQFRFSFIRRVFWSVIVLVPVMIVLAFVFYAGDSVTKPVGWEKSFFISPAGMQAKNAAVASIGKYVIAVYEGTVKNEHAIYASVSFDGGISYLRQIKIAVVNTVIDNNPTVAISGNGHVFVSWQNHVVEEATNRIFYSMSGDMGASWSAPQQIFIGTEIEMLPRVYYDNRGRLHLFYHAFVGGAFNLFHAESPDEKTFFTTASIIRLTPEMKGAFFPAIHVSGNNFYLVWQGKGRNFTDDLYFIESSNYGKSWSSAEQVTDTPASNASPDIVMRNGILYLVYQNNDGKSWAIKMLRRIGSRWSETPLLISGTDANCYSPGLDFARKDELLITWYDTREGKTKIFARRYDTLRKKLLDEQKISLKPEAAYNPRVISSGNKAIVFWQSLSRIEAKYTDVYVAPPKVFSASHPDGIWTRNSTARIEWTPPYDESGIVGYATIITKPTRSGIMPDINPTIQNYNANTRRIILSRLDDGITYFHIRAVDGAGNFSRTIHYRIQVSAHPMPMPVVVSPTHPQGRPSDDNSPRFRWSVDDLQRLKGFVYGISRDSVVEPRNFTQDFETILRDLKPGNYFFSLAAIDKTNQRSQVADYYFRVGDTKEIDPDDLIRKIRKRETVERRYLAKREKPSIEINLPFDRERNFGERSFRGLIAVKNISKEQMAGYYLGIGTGKKEAPRRITQKEDIISVEGLENGTYYITARGRYYRYTGGKRKYYWTEPVTAVFSIKIPEHLSPVEYYGRSLLQKLAPRAAAVTLVISLLTFLTAGIGFGSRLMFYGRLLHFKARSVIRLIF